MHLPVDINVSLIEEMVEDIDGINRLLSLLFVSKNEIDPVVHVGRDIVALEGRTMHSDEFTGVSLGPGGQHDVVQLDPTLFDAWFGIIPWLTLRDNYLEN